MPKMIFLLSLLVLLDSSDCGAGKNDEKIRSLQADVEQLKTEVAELKQTQKATPDHHYELRSEGLRTWRFDPATGDTCIQLTSTDDWKSKKTKSQSCACVDSSQHYMEMPSGTDQQQKTADSYYNLFVKTNCGTDSAK